LAQPSLLPHDKEDLAAASFLSSFLAHLRCIKADGHLSQQQQQQQQPTYLLLSLNAASICVCARFSTPTAAAAAAAAAAGPKSLLGSQHDVLSFGWIGLGRSKKKKEGSPFLARSLNSSTFSFASSAVASTSDK
jgi:hypothetical protein